MAQTQTKFMKLKEDNEKKNDIKFIENHEMFENVEMCSQH